ncbi:sulfate transporter [Sphaerisporangium rufum]|uniref:Sulfate transporter n=1 Tax=Sphaerisporangium rufum TaxID=1381558 RepID=A0A919QZJ2_9ACTN|nr:SulP family inorganic anion transporter [Sphaerisporangium rufum]GII77049.1 sulfate transporter [Sphaerisporangium rufum]
MSVVNSTLRRALRTDLTASMVVFLVALPLCVGVAVASGVPAELGLITGIVGGLVVGMLPGSSMQVSGPAAGLTVLVAEAVGTYGLRALGVIVLGAGLLQLLLGAVRLGRWFRAISVAVVEGMLAGIGLVIIAGQLYAMAGAPPPASGLGKIFGLPGLAGVLAGSAPAATAFALGAGTIAVIALWSRLPARVRVVPGALAAVALASGLTALLGLPVARIQVEGLAAAIQPPGPAQLGLLGDAGVLATIAAFALIASAETLFCAAAVDRMHDGPRTDFNKELLAQGVGNVLCGMLGALPMTGVIMRSAANVHAGAKTKMSRVVHGMWLLLFAALLPAVLGLMPVAALAGVLIHAGFKLLPIRTLVPLWRASRGEALIVAVTALSIVAVSMFEGVLIGLALAVIKCAWETSHIQVEVDDRGEGPVLVVLTGNATFLRLPKMLDTLEALPTDRPIELNLAGLRHLDHACRTALTAWTERHNSESAVPVRLIHA